MLVLPVVAAALAALGPIAAAPTTAPAVDVCVVDDPRAIELSGLVITADGGYASVVDSQWDESQVQVVFFDQECQVTRTVAYPTAARDPEDIAVAPDGSLWVADIGDNTADRATVALWHLPPDGSAPVIYRLTYPDGPHDAEAMFFDTDGQPVIVTKTVGAAGIYTPTGPLVADTAQGVPLREVGQWAPPDVPDTLAGFLGQLITGAAVSTDRTRVALRTYEAAYDWAVPPGTIMVTAITTTPPRITPLADEQGEGVCFTPDGGALLTVSDQSGPTTLRRYPLAADPTDTDTDTAGTDTAGTDTAGTAVGESTGDRRWVALAGGGVGVVVLALLLIGVYRVLRRRSA